jgi:hypothetical protein
MPTDTSTPAHSACAVMTRDRITWRQAGEGWTVLVALSAAAATTVAVLKFARTALVRRS